MLLLELLQLLRWRRAKFVVHHERNVREEQQHIYVARTSNNRVISLGELYCCFLPQCEALRTCRSGFPIATELNVICGQIWMQFELQNCPSRAFAIDGKIYNPIQQICEIGSQLTFLICSE